MPSAWQGAWLGIWPGDWFGESEGGTGPDYLDAELTATGSGSAQLGAEFTLAAALSVTAAGSAQFGAVVAGGTVEEPSQGGAVWTPIRRPRRPRPLEAALVVVGSGSAVLSPELIPAARGRTRRRWRDERALLLAA
jgi:hypothetical protein